MPFRGLKDKNKMMLVIVFLPLLTFLSIGFFGRRIGTEGATKLATGALLCAFLLSCYAFYDVALQGNVYFCRSCSLDTGW